MFEENRRTKLLTLGAICFGLFMVMLDNTVVNLALPTIQRKSSVRVSTNSNGWSTPSPCARLPDADRGDATAKERSLHGTGQWLNLPVSRQRTCSEKAMGNILYPFSATRHPCSRI